MTFFASSLTVSRRVPAASLRRRCPFGRSCKVPSFSIFRSDSPLILMSDLSVFLSCCRTRLGCSPGSEVIPLAVGCSNCRGLRSPSCVRTRMRWQSNRRSASLHHSLYLIRCCRSRIRFVEPSAGTMSRLSSIIRDKRLTGNSTLWQLQCIRQEPALSTTGAVRCDPVRHSLLSALTSNHDSARCEPRQQTASHRATAASRLATSACMELSAFGDNSHHHHEKGGDYVSQSRSSKLCTAVHH